MSWCPKCYTEYPEDWSTCWKCNTRLLDQLPDSSKYPDCGNTYNPEQNSCENCGKQPLRSDSAEAIFLTDAHNKPGKLLAQLIVLWLLSAMSISLYSWNMVLASAMSIYALFHRIVAPGLVIYLLIFGLAIGAAYLAFAVGYARAGWFSKQALWLGWTSAFIITCILFAKGYIDIPLFRGKLIATLVAGMSTPAVSIWSGIRFQQQDRISYLLTPLAWTVLMMAVSVIGFYWCFKFPAPS
jgi:hypothetical protein